MHAYLTRFDHAVASLVKLLPAWLSPLMKFATLIGEPVVTVGVAVTIGVLAVVKRAPRIAIAEVCALVAFAGNTGIKHVIHRTRPETLFVQNMKIKSYSFPSGHAFGSMVIYGLLAYLAYTRLPHPWNIWVTITLSVLILLIGTSRIYLGAHFPSDVAIGWLLGGLCLFIIIKLVKP